MFVRCPDCQVYVSSLQLGGKACTAGIIHVGDMLWSIDKHKVPALSPNPEP